MTIEDVTQRLWAIERASRDYEAAHSLEDDLFIDVLRAIAAGDCADPAAIASAALESCNIGFARRCA